MILSKMGRRNELEGKQEDQIDYPLFDQLNYKIPLRYVQDQLQVSIPNKMTVNRHVDFQDGAGDPIYECSLERYNFHHVRKIVQISSRNNV